MARLLMGPERDDLDGEKLALSSGLSNGLSVGLGLLGLVETIQPIELEDP